MNTAIVRLYGAILVLFALLIGFTSNWAVFDAEELEAKTENKRPLIEQQQIARGKIETRDGELVARSVKRGQGETLRYVRKYPTGSMFAHPIGYDFVEFGRTGLEQSENDFLVGDENEFASIFEQIKGTTEEGSDVVITIDGGAQRLATDLLQNTGTPGSVVAIEPKTGAIRVMASTPSFDPNEIPDRIGEFNQGIGGEPVLLNRATQGAYPPGSTMKVVTAAAALDSGEFEPDTVVNGDNGVEISGFPLNNFAQEDFGDVTLTRALTESVNTAWAQVAEDLGTDTMVDYMEKFGFYSDFDFDYPSDQIRPSGPSVQTKRGTRLVKDGFDVGRVAIGQGGAEGQNLSAPLQMAIVAGTVGNDGVRMKPTFIEKVTDPDGRVTDQLDPDEETRVISTEAAEKLQVMMQSVTEEGTASGLSVGGVPFAGKTGTAEKNNSGLNQPWFIMFAPVDDPQIAVAATIEECQGCTGGQVAGPIATAVAQDLLGSG